MLGMLIMAIALYRLADIVPYRRSILLLFVFFLFTYAMPHISHSHATSQLALSVVVKAVNSDFVSGDATNSGGGDSNPLLALPIGYSLFAIVFSVINMVHSATTAYHFAHLGARPLAAEAELALHPIGDAAVWIADTAVPEGAEDGDDGIAMVRVLWSARPLLANE